MWLQLHRAAALRGEIVSPYPQTVYKDWNAIAMLKLYIITIVLFKYNLFWQN